MSSFRIIHEFFTVSAERTASFGLSPSGLLDVPFKYACVGRESEYGCVGLRSEGPETTVLSTLSRRQALNNPG
jgi:hypothetical protein